MPKRTNKGKTTIPLAAFLGPETQVVKIQRTDWAAAVDEHEELENRTTAFNVSNLPVAPRAALDIDFSHVPNDPPFVAYVANLSFELDEDKLRTVFADLHPRTVRILKDGARSRGIGLVEFDARENLIDALKRTDKEFYGRKIRIQVSEKSDSHQNDGTRGNNFHRSNRTPGGEDRPEMEERWERKNPKFEESWSDRQGTRSNSDRANPFANKSDDFRDGQRGNDYGFGYPRSRDSRSGGGQDVDRPANPRHRYHDEGAQQNRTDGDRPRYNDRFRDRRDTPNQNASNDDAQASLKERPRLQLQPRTKLREDISPSISSTDDCAAVREAFQNQESKNASDSEPLTDRSTVEPVTPSRGAGVSVFGNAKPVDTTARELEIEKKLKELQVTPSAMDNEERNDSLRQRPTQTNSEPFHRNRREEERSGSDRDHRHNISSRRDYNNDRSNQSHSHRSSDQGDRPRDSWRQRPVDASGHNWESDSSVKVRTRDMTRPILVPEEKTSKLPLANKFDLLDEDIDHDQRVVTPE